MLDFLFSLALIGAVVALFAVTELRRPMSKPFILGGADEPSEDIPRIPLPEAPAPSPRQSHIIRPLGVPDRGSPVLIRFNGKKRIGSFRKMRGKRIIVDLPRRNGRGGSFSVRRRESQIQLI